MRSPKQIELQGQTPEELARALDIQIALYRQKRTSLAASPQNRAAILIGAVLLIIVGAGFALMVLSQRIQSEPRPARAATAAGSPTIDARH